MQTDPDGSLQSAPVLYKEDLRVNEIILLAQVPTFTFRWICERFSCVLLTMSSLQAPVVTQRSFLTSTLWKHLFALPGCFQQREKHNSDISHQIQHSFGKPRALPFPVGTVGDLRAHPTLPWDKRPEGFWFWFSSPLHKSIRWLKEKKRLLCLFSNYVRKVD